MSAPRAIAYAGYPGAGKTEAAKFGVKWVGGERVSMGDAVKELACGELGSGATSHEIGLWATVARKKSGPDIMARKLIRKWRAEGYPEEPIHIEGVRSIYEVAVFQREFGFIPILFVEAPFETRLRRLQGRGRDGESAFQEADLAERDRREARWGMGELDLLSQDRVANDHELPTLRNRVGSRLVTVHKLPTQPNHNATLSHEHGGSNKRRTNDDPSVRAGR